MSETKLSNPSDWIDLHGDALYAYALLQLGDPEVAEDQVQETLLAGIKARESFRGDCSERTWLIAILKNKIRDYFRRREFQSLPESTDQVDEMFTASGKWKHEPQSWKVDPQAEVSSEEFWAVLHQCLHILAPAMRGAFCLREFHELKTEQICKNIEISPSNLWTLLHRARMRLRACLEKNWYGRE